MSTNGEYNKVQINYSVRKNGDNEITEKSTLVNIRVDDVEEALTLYNQVKKRLNGDLGGSDPTHHPDSSPFSSDCPKCGGLLIERKSKEGKGFFGCSNYPKCRFTKDV